MPPTLNHNETREQATIRWLTQILAALVAQTKDGVLKISRSSLAADYNGQDLVESRDRNGHIQLRFEFVKHIAIYPLQTGGARWDEQSGSRSEANGPTTQTTSPPAPAPLPLQQELFSQMPNSGSVTRPKDKELIRQLEETLKKQKLVSKIMAGRLAQEQRKRQGLEGLLESAEMFSPKA